MDSSQFVNLVNEAYAPFLGTLGFAMSKPSISGREYSVRFANADHVVALSFEPGDDAFFVFVYTVGVDGLSDPDDLARTPRLADLNTRYMKSVTVAERASNQKMFRSIMAHDEDEAQVLKGARELQLVLPKYLTDQQQHQM